MSRYPDGAFGAALLLVRLCYGLVGFGLVPMIADTPQTELLLRGIASIAALGLLVGFATRWIALALCAGVVAALMRATAPSETLLFAGHLGACLALAAMGAGAFSLDARLYGRRVIQLAPNTPEGGSAG